MSQPTVQNIVCTCSVGTILYLPFLVRALRSAEYNPKRFAAVTVRLKDPKTTALVFASGKIVCTGSKCLNAARLAVLKYVKLIQDAIQGSLRVYNFEVQNMVASAYVGTGLSLDRCCRLYPNESSYEPELFPGLVFRQHGSAVVFLLFLSGRIVITGAKTEDQIHGAYAKMYGKLMECREMKTVTKDEEHQLSRKKSTRRFNELVYGKELHKLFL